MKNQEWKVTLSMLLILSITTFSFKSKQSESHEQTRFAKRATVLVEFGLRSPSDEARVISDFYQGTSVSTSSDTIVVKTLIDAKADLANGIIRIYIPGGFVPQENPNRRLMKNQYKIDFIDEGCVRISPADKLAAYNKTVFAYLDQKYGKQWREYLTVETY